MTKDELQRRIIEGCRKIDQLCRLSEKLPKGLKRDELGDRSARMLKSLYDLEDGFIELYPDECVFQDRKCKNPNKGCSFVCDKCPAYLNSIYGSGQKQVTLF